MQRRIQAKADAIVANAQVNLARGATKFCFKILPATVLGGVSQCFLKYSKQTQRDIAREARWYIVGSKINGDVLVLAKFFTKSVHGRNDSQQLQLGRM